MARSKHRGELLQRFPGLDRRRLDLLSDLLARIDMAREYLDDHGLMRNTREAHPLLDRLDRWERRSWQMLSELQPTKQAPVNRPVEHRTRVDLSKLTDEELAILKKIQPPSDAADKADRE
jgi:hypothetical protein